LGGRGERGLAAEILKMESGQLRKGGGDARVEQEGGSGASHGRRRGRGTWKKMRSTRGRWELNVKEGGGVCEPSGGKENVNDEGRERFAAGGKGFIA